MLDVGRRRPVRDLTPQQRRVLHLVAVGCGNKQIAARLRVSEHTANWHVRKLLERFQVPNRAALVRVAMDAGVLRAVRASNTVQRRG